MEQRSRCIMHLVARMTLISKQLAAVDPPQEVERDRIYDQYNIFPRCVPDDNSAKWFEPKRRDVGPVLQQSACPGLASVYTDPQDRGDDAVDRHGCSQRGVHQRFDSLADSTA